MVLVDHAAERFPSPHGCLEGHDGRHVVAVWSPWRDWCGRHGLPLPLALTVVRRELAEDAEAVCAGVRASLLFALRHRRDPVSRAHQVLRRPRQT